MSGSCRFILFALLLMFFCSCASQTPTWRSSAQQTLIQLEREGARGSFPDDYASIVSTFDNAEKLLAGEQGIKAAENQYQLAYQKGLLLQLELEKAQARLLEEKRQQEQKRQAELAEQKRRRQEEEKIQARLAAKEGTQTANNNKHQAVQEERGNLPIKYTVRRGETLPQIAARTEIYSNAELWPLIYRANRDQIRDPYQLWPGQVLKIPRGFSKEDAADARRQAAKLGL
jgi:nucleoid-associated protein YgaU